MSDMHEQGLTAEIRARDAASRSPARRTRKLAIYALAVALAGVVVAALLPVTETLADRQAYPPAGRVAAGTRLGAGQERAAPARAAYSVIDHSSVDWKSVPREPDASPMSVGAYER